MAFVSIEYEAIGGGRFKVLHGDGVLISSTRQPFSDGARALLEIGGCDLDDTVAMFKKDGMLCITGRLAFVAAHTAIETNSGPRIAKWEPFNGIGKNSDADE